MIIKKEKIVHGIKIVKNRDFSYRMKIVSNVRNNDMSIGTAIMSN